MEWTWMQVVDWIPFAGVVGLIAVLMEAMKYAWRRLLAEDSTLLAVLEALKKFMPVAMGAAAAFIPGVIPSELEWPWISEVGICAMGGANSAWVYEVFRKKAKEKAGGLKLPGDK